jgi:oxygen-independent coproporphyrinogen-3 oxidase
MVEAMLREWKSRRTALSTTEVSTLYFGGGTPSLLSEAQLGKIIDEIYQFNGGAEISEITLEANPEDLTSAKINELKRLGVNRLSIGIQSFFNEHLEWMNRKHTASEAESAVKRAQDAGIENITIDLIFGIPISTSGQWEENVQRALALNTPHLSAYALTIEERTVFGKKFERGLLQEADDELVSKQFLYLHEITAQQGFDHYELSNYAKPGYESKHNGNYWKGIPYVGVGPAAHSFEAGKRRWNISNNPQYIKCVMSNEVYWEEETLSQRDVWNEYIMTGLRTKNGIAFSKLPATFFSSNEAYLHECVNDGYGVLSKDAFRLTPTGWLISDRIIASLFIDENDF